MRPVTTWLLLLLLHACRLRLGLAFLPSPQITFARQLATPKALRRNASSMLMALTPVGPFCPFRSSAANEMEPHVEKLNAGTPEFATEMAKIQLAMQMGDTPDPEKLLRVANEMETTVEEWENLIARLRLSQDFQTREYAKLTQAHLQTYGVTTESIASMMRWQSGCMKAMARNTPPPMPPPDLDLAKLMQQDQSARPPPSITAMAAAEKITSTPFTGTEAAFDSPTVKEEYEKLCRDHAALIEMGASYATFDPLGKISYLDEIEKIQERWDVFFARFQLLGQLNSEFTQQCEAFLESMRLTEADYKDLLKKTHQIMREDAERERIHMA